MNSREQEEYKALRATIRERGSTRIWIFAFGLLGWAALTLITILLAAPPVVTTVPLVALAGTFEAIYFLHVGAERIGRYLFVFHSDEWEQVVAAFGAPTGAAGADPLFPAVFLIATLVNLIPLLVTRPIVQELVFVVGAHALFALRLITARSAAARQRRIDTERFRQIRKDIGYADG